MPALMRVRKTGGDKGTVPGYRTLNVLGVGRGGRRGILYHRLFSSEEDAFESESTEIRTALEAVGAALAGKTVTYLLDSQFDDVAVWGTIWRQGQHLVCRLKHAERTVEVPDEAGGWRPGIIAEAQERARELARVRTELLVRKRGQRYTKRQPCTVRIAACPVRVRYPTDVRDRRTSPKRVRAAWLVVVRVEDVDWAPWVLLTDWPVEDDAGAVQAFRMYRTRWAAEMTQPHCPDRRLRRRSCSASVGPSCLGASRCQGVRWRPRWVPAPRRRPTGAGCSSPPVAARARANGPAPARPPRGSSGAAAAPPAGRGPTRARSSCTASPAACRWLGPGRPATTRARQAPAAA
jgi:hypothetical protein